jgi:hypothetical protein
MQRLFLSWGVNLSVGHRIVGFLAITSGRALASYILTVPLLGDGPEASSDFGPHPHLNGFGAVDSPLLSLYPSSSSSYPSPYLTNLLGTGLIGLGAIVRRTRNASR